MELFKKRSTAIAVFIVVVIAFTLLGCHRSLGKACRGVEDAFFDKTLLADYGVYTAPGDQLGNSVKLANRLLSVINTDAMAAEYAAVAQARQALSDALDARDISDIYDANEALAAAVSSAESLVASGAELPPSSDDYDAIVSDFHSAQRVVTESPYNTLVDDFLSSTVRPFPTNVLRILSFTALPEKYE